MQRTSPVGIGGSTYGGESSQAWRLVPGGLDLGGMGVVVELRFCRYVAVD